MALSQNTIVKQITKLCRDSGRCFYVSNDYEKTECPLYGYNTKCCHTIEDDWNHIYNISNQEVKDFLREVAYESLHR